MTAASEMPGEPACDEWLEGRGHVCGWRAALLLLLLMMLLDMLLRRTFRTQALEGLPLITVVAEGAAGQ